VLLGLRLALMRRSAYRHLLFNAIPYKDQGIPRQLVMLAVACIFCEAWAKGRAEHGSWTVEPDVWMANLGASLVQNAAAIVGVLAAIWWHYASNGLAMVKYNYCVMAMVLAMFGRLLVGVLFIWDYDARYLYLLHWYVVASSVASLSAWLVDPMSTALVFVAVGQACRIGVTVAMQQVQTSLRFPLLV
jgi:hypothetical protein